MPLTLEPNAVVAGKYRLDALLGRGGMGEVWSAEQATTRKRVAMKFLLGDNAKNEDTRRRFVREARAACSVQHPNVVQIHDVIETEDATPVLIMELLKGESLEAKLRDGKLGVEETISILLRVVSAVGTAHTQGVVHRDLKPDNIFLSETPDGVDVKVLDFGIAKVGASEDGSQTGALTSTGTMLGTPFYMSPEQAFGEKRVDHRADIWSLGIVMFRCLSGELPTRADNLGQILKIIMTRAIPKLSEVAPHVPPELASLVDKMLGYSPSDRPADLREVKVSLERILSVGAADRPPAIDTSTMGGVSMVPTVPATTTSGPAAKRTSSGVIALGGAALLVALTAGVVLWKRSSSEAAVASTNPAPTTTAVATETATAEPTTTVSATSPPSAVTTPAPIDPIPVPSSAIGGTTKPQPNKPQPSTTKPTTTTLIPPPSATTKGPGIIETPGF